MSHHPRRAFSLIELAVVLIVIAVIAAIAIPTFQSVISESEDNAAEAEVNATMRNAVAIARANNRLTPNQSDLQTAFDEIATAATAGLSAAASEYNVCAENAVSSCGAGVDVYWNEDAGVVGVVVDDDPRVLARIAGQSVTDVWVDPSGTLADALAGPTPGPPPVPQAPAETRLLLVGGESTSNERPAIDDVRVTSGAGTTGADLYLFDDFNRLGGPVTTGTLIQTLTSDTGVNNSPVAGVFGAPANSWIAEADFAVGGGYPAVSAGVLTASGAGSLDRIAWDFTAGNYEVSFKVVTMGTSPTEQAGLQVLDGAFTSAASLSVNDAGVMMGTPAGQTSPVSAVTAGDRVGIRLQGTTYSLMVNDAAVWSSSLPVAVSGTVAKNFADAGYDYTACFAELWTPGTDLASSTWLTSANLSADGSFTLTGAPAQSVNLRIYCPSTGPGGQSQAWWYSAGTDSDSTPATEIALVADTPVNLGTLDVRTV